MTTPPASRSQADLRRVLESLPDPFFTLDGDWRFTFVNGHGLRFLDREQADLMGQVFWEVCPGTQGTRFETELRRAGNGAGVSEYEALFAPLGRWLEVRVFPGAGGLGVHCRDVTGRRLAAARAEALAGVAQGLVAAVTAQEVAGVLTGEVRAALGAYSAVLYRLEGDLLREVARTGLAAPGAWREFSLHAPHLPAAVARDGEARFLRGADFGRDYPGTWRAERTRAAAVLPLAARGELLGVLAYSYEHEPAFDEPERSSLLTLSGQGALALERARQAGAARDRETRYQVLSNVTNDAVWDWEFADHRVTWNEGVSVLFGYAPDEVEPTHRWWKAHLHPEDRERIVSGLHAVVGGTAAGEWREEYRFRRRDGSYAAVLDRGQVIRDADGRAIRMIGGMTDLSERERAAELQAESDALSAFAAFTEQVGTETDLPALARQAVQVLHEALEGVGVGYYEWEGGAWQARALAGNLPPGVRRLALGRCPVERLEQAADVLFVEGAEETLAAAFFPYFIRGGPRGLLTMASAAHPAWAARARAVFASVARGLALASERSETARVLQEQNAELHARSRALEGFADLARDLAFETDTLALVRRAQEIVLTLLPPGVAVYYEPQGEGWRVRAQTGDAGDPVLQAALDAGLPLGQTANLMPPWRTGEAHYQDACAPATDGPAQQTRHIGATATVPILVGGQPQGVFAVALFGTWRWDATDRAVLDTAARHLSLALERAAVAAELGRQRLELEATNQELGAFSYTVSHDLRAPLRHIAGFAGMLRRAVETGDAARAARALDVIDGAVAQAGRLIDALLGFSHLSRQELSKTEVDLRRLLESVRGEAEAEAGGREVEWVVADLPGVRGDPDLLRQVLSNLLSNAVKYSTRSERLRVEVWGESRPAESVISVRDSGAGFDPRYADRLFGVFQRLHRQDEFGGTGIGLATVRRIVQRHGGRVWAESQPGQGATFHFSLPQEPPRPESGAGCPASA